MPSRGWGELYSLCVRLSDSRAELRHAVRGFRDDAVEFRHSTKRREEDTPRREELVGIKPMIDCPLEQLERPRGISSHGVRLGEMEGHVGVEDDGAQALECRQRL